MKISDKHKNYWNDTYMAYWRGRVAEAGSSESKIVLGDHSTEGDEVYERIFSSVPFVPGNLLDVGCAWGRMFNLYKQYDMLINGCDISSAMIEAARKDWEGFDCVETLNECPAEKLQYPDEFFNNVVCIATFDATQQKQAICEFLRVTRPGANIYITGKNNYYEFDDFQALAAEQGARSKGHPNYFTDTGKLISQMLCQGHLLKSSYFFSRRGDFASMKFSNTLPEKFYEFFLVFERGVRWWPLRPFSSPYSRTFNEKDL